MLAWSGSIFRFLSFSGCSIAKLGPAKPSMPRFVPTVAVPCLQDLAHPRDADRHRPRTSFRQAESLHSTLVRASTLRTSRPNPRLSSSLRRGRRQARSVHGAGAGPPRAAGGMYVPWATLCTDVSVEFGRATLASASQEPADGVCPRTCAKVTEPTNADITTSVRRSVSILVGYRCQSASGGSG